MENSRPSPIEISHSPIENEIFDVECRLPFRNLRRDATGSSFRVEAPSGFATWWRPDNRAKHSNAVLDAAAISNCMAIFGHATTNLRVVGRCRDQNCFELPDSTFRSSTYSKFGKAALAENELKYLAVLHCKSQGTNGGELHIRTCQRSKA